MAKIEIMTDSSDIHTKATKLNIPHAHECRGYSSHKIWFDLEIDEKVAIEKGFNITVKNNVELPYICGGSETYAKIFADADFNIFAFLDKVSEKIEQEQQEKAQRELQEQREKEERQRQEFARKQAQELLKEDFEKLEGKIQSLNEKLESSMERRKELARWLEALIKVSGAHELEVAGLLKPTDEETEETETTEEQQEALETCGLDR